MAALLHVVEAGNKESDVVTAVIIALVRILSSETATPSCAQNVRQRNIVYKLIAVIHKASLFLQRQPGALGAAGLLVVAHAKVAFVRGDARAKTGTHVQGLTSRIRTATPTYPV